MKLLTRRQIIETWERVPDYLDYYCCPECRDILTISGNNEYLNCTNPSCTNVSKYNKDGTPMLEITTNDIDRWKDFRDPNREAKKKSFESAIDQYIADTE